MKTIKIGHAPKTVALENNEFLYFWYANNAGRGRNNVTVIRSTSAARASVSEKQDGVIARTTTSGWAGNVNFSKFVQNELGL